MKDYDIADEADDGDAHCCSTHADADGVCDICGALVYGSWAYCKEYGCDPPEAIDDILRCKAVR